MAEFPTIESSVSCAVCGQSFRFITGTHLRKHGLTTADYSAQYPNAPMACAEVGSAIRTHHAGKPKSDEHKAKLKTHLKRVAKHVWSPEARRKVSASLRGRVFSEEHRQKIGAANKRQWANGERKLTFNPKWEQDVAVWLVEAGEEFHHQYHVPGFSHPYDFYLPQRNLLIELDGCYWHGCQCQGGPANDSIRKTVTKDRSAEEVAANFGYRLVRIRECEFSKEKFMGVLHG